YEVVIDGRLRSATRGLTATQYATADGEIGAKQIQARMRAGATPEEVAEASGWSVDRVTAFAAPIIQERSWIAQKAQACQIGRDEEDPTLAEIVEQRLGERGVDAEDARWDSWLAEDGEWTVLLAYPAGRGDRVATWRFDPRAKTVTPRDEDAGWLISQPVEAERQENLVQFNREPDLEDEDERAPSRNHPAARMQRTQAPTEEARHTPTFAPVKQTPPPEEPAAQADAQEALSWDDVLFGPPMDEKDR
ncbi:septation protein SepH, partial [Candidatus Nanopelagicales bacterium]|nr:septation protein SepH [Candidatus Nanopelagicales bacterium]